MSIHVHIINHTHWDREWFLTSEYTSRWIPALLENLEKRAAENPSFHYWLDGQTLVVEDLLRIAPEMESRVRRLVRDGHLKIGPYYSQPDWQLATGELLVRNLQYGIQDAHRLGGTADSGWLVDTFGHIGQTPQIHDLFGLRAVFVWRGVPQLHPYFHWKGADGTSILTINLFGGYRNLFGVTHVPDVAVRRLTAEVERLAPHYPTPDIPLFDGYDLENNPEDPLSFYARMEGIDSHIELHEATPASFASLISEKNLSLPTLHGELNSGKFGATFPGAFSARNYLKIMAHDCQDLLFRLCEPLTSLASLHAPVYPVQRFEAIGRLLLQNGVHDCICGVSIDQVHEKMVWSYRDAFDELLGILRGSLERLMPDFAPGEYAVSTNPFAGDYWLVEAGSLRRLKTNGIGIWPVAEKIPADPLPPMPEQTADFLWSNDFYQARLQPDGGLRLGDADLGELRVYRELGDTYSDERGDLLGVMLPLQPPRVVERSALHAVLEWDSAWRNDPARISARIRLIFDPSPLVRWEIDLDSHGADLDVEMYFATGRSGEIWAGMPFDLVQRAEVDADLLPRRPPPELSSVLLGQRELGEVRTFPFHDMVAISDDHGSSLVLARGLHAYQAKGGTLSLTLRRSVEWLTRADLEHRIGDAGPFFYVPDARSECRVRHELAFAALPYPATSMKVQHLNAFFQNPPLLVRSGSQGARHEWEFMQEDLPLSSLQRQGNALLARFYNPTGETVRLSRTYPETDVWGEVQGECDSVPPGKIVTLRLGLPGYEPAEADGSMDPSSIGILNLPAWRVGTNQAMPDPDVLADLEEKIRLLDGELEQIAASLAQVRDRSERELGTRLHLEHRQAALQRERLEYRLSLLLNRRKLDHGGNSPREALEQVDPEIAVVGKELNRLRIKRRIYDYVVQALA